MTDSLELREVLYGVFVIAIFLFFRRGIVQTAADLFNRFFGRRRAQPATCHASRVGAWLGPPARRC